MKEITLETGPQAVGVRTVLVTGAGRGIGRALARRLGRRGDRVIGTVRDAERARRLTTEAHAEGLPLTYVALELADAGQVKQVADFLVEQGGLDVLVNNAGYGLFGAVEEFGEEELRRQFEVNFFGPLLLTRRLLPALRARRGRIVWVGSLGGRFALPFQAPYSASKAAIAAMSDSLRMELRSFGVTVTCVEPGDFATDFTEARERCRRDDSVYAPMLARCLEAVEKTEREAPGPDRAAREIERVLAKRRPVARYPVGPLSSAMVLAQRLLPDALRERIVRLIYRS